MKEAIAILTGGGPAPGMNTVVGSVAKTFLRQGYRVIGLHEGYTGLFNPSPRTVDIDYPMADGIFNQGGSFLQMSRFCHYPMIVIPEMFDKTEITVEKIVNLVISSIIKRKIMGMDYGAAVISEGVFHALSDEEIRKSGIHFTYDEHGHPELGKVSKAHIFNEMIEMKLKELGLKVKSRPVELGYEIRCQTPIAYDLTYCSELGIGVHKLFAEGKTGCMVYVDSEGNVSPLYLKDLQDPTTGKIPPRLVDIKSDKFTSVVETILNAITPADYEAAKAYVPNPEEYDFHKILNWK